MATPSNYDSPLLLPGLTYATIGMVPGAGYVDDVLSAPELAADWWMSFKFLFTSQPVFGYSENALWFGDDAGTAFGINLTNGPPATGDDAVLNCGTLGSEEVAVTTPAAVDVEHEVLLQWIAAGGLLRAYVDGDLVGSAAGVSLPMGLTGDLELYLATQADATSSPIYAVEVGRGVYGG